MVYRTVSQREEKLMKDGVPNGLKELVDLLLCYGRLGNWCRVGELLGKYGEGVLMYLMSRSGSGYIWRDRASVWIVLVMKSGSLSLEEQKGWQRRLDDLVALDGGLEGDLSVLELLGFLDLCEEMLGDGKVNWLD